MSAETAVLYALVPLFGIAFAVIAYDWARSHRGRPPAGGRGFDVLPPKDEGG